MRRLAAGFGIVLLVASWALVAAAFITARSADPMLWPPRPDGPTIEIVVTSNGYHSGVALPRAALAELASGRGYPALIAVTQRFAAYDWIEFGWGDAEFYRLVPTVNDVSWRLALRALFWPGNTSVLHVVGITGDPARAFVSADLVRVPLSRNGFDQLLAKLDASFNPPQGGALQDLGRGLYGPSLFYPANGTFSVLRVCNHWIDELLGAAGLPTAPVLATLPAGLMLNLRWRAGLAPQAPAALSPRKREGGSSAAQ
jgi:uncharacterized protein (TIGR02117 family)